MFDENVFCYCNLHGVFTKETKAEHANELTKEWKRREELGGRRGVSVKRERIRGSLRVI